ncbi:MAG: UDP-N-acetylmuramoyl-tripeptide--D-alanyl-D-alanine ligase [Oscillospiraceae bacterium]|nr:UDP-N-acetylmuramoyl-tripeptide--D-alanyl-D-alanine ligase [Oscillospiraceae bacterium]
MGTITLQQAAQWCGGLIDQKYKDVTFLGAGNDSRKIQPGQLFIALQGERDGHEFIPMAMEKGAAAVLCSRSVGDIPCIIVPDTRKALGDIARGERQRIGMKVVGITGSVGKSTTKEMVCAVLSQKYKVSKTPANHNNDIGMPMAILSMPEDTQVAVLEMGMNHFREIAYLASIGQPDIGVITNIGTMHIEHLGSQQGILQAKLEILEGMKEDGVMIFNGDDPLLWNLHRQQERTIEYFSVQNPECRYQGSDLVAEHGSLRFLARIGTTEFPIELALEGEHYVSDAMAAVGVGVTLGVEPEQIRQALERFQNMAGRQEIFQAKDCTIIKDCYNAGPESMAAALAVLGNRSGRRVAVLGDMLELGVCAPAEHYRIGRIAAEKAELVLAYGPNSSRIVSGAITGGLPEHMAKSYDQQDALVEDLRRMVKPGDVILVKGSRGMRMELVLEGFLEER